MEFKENTIFITIPIRYPRGPKGKMYLSSMENLKDVEIEERCIKIDGKIYNKTKVAFNNKWKGLKAGDSYIFVYMGIFDESMVTLLVFEHDDEKPFVDLHYKIGSYEYSGILNKIPHIQGIESSAS